MKIKKDKEINNFTTPEGKLLPLDKLPAELREKLKKYAVLDIYKDQAREIIEASQVDLYSVIDLWLSDKRKSDRTRILYSTALARFFEYLESINVSPILIKAKHTDRYLRLLEDQFRANTVRLEIAACSSFYAYLLRHDHIKRNPFRGIDRPQKEYKKAVQTDQKKTSPVMNREEYKRILDEIENRKNISGNRSCDQRTRAGAKRLFLAVHLMATYGMRVGAVPTVEIRKDCLLYTDKGGKAFKKFLRDETKEILKEYPSRKSADGAYNGPLTDYLENTLTVAISSVTGFLARAHAIRHRYTAHDFRHFYARCYLEDGGTVVGLRDELGHSSLSVTDSYVQRFGL